MSRVNGQNLDDFDHLRQSITDILTTPLGSRVMRRDYGSELPDLIDEPMHKNTLIRLYYAIAVALERWEPRLRLQRVQVYVAQGDGRMDLDLWAEYLPHGKPIVLEGIRL